MNKLAFAAVLAATTALAVPASAATFLFTGPANTVPSFTATSDGYSVTATGFTYAVTAASLNNISQLAGPVSLRVHPDGVGVCTEAVNNNECRQVDTNGTNEALRLSLSPATNALQVRSLTLALVDNNDTIKIFGKEDDGSLTILGLAGSIRNPTASGVTSTNLGGNRYRVNFNPAVGGYSTLYLSSWNNESDGYQVTSMVASVPEPAAWAMMIGGFGLVGAASRRRKLTVTYA